MLWYEFLKYMQVVSDDPEATSQKHSDSPWVAQEEGRITYPKNKLSVTGAKNLEFGGGSITHNASNMLNIRSFSKHFLSICNMGSFHYICNSPGQVGMKLIT